jgi:hypothetical protein
VLGVKKKLKLGIEGVKLTVATALVNYGVSLISSGQTWFGAGIIAVGFCIYAAYVFETGGTQ